MCHHQLVKHLDSPDDGLGCAEEGVCAGRQRIERRSNILMRELVTAGQLKRVPRTENNPHGLLIVNWRTLLNKDIEQKTKINY